MEDQEWSSYYYSSVVVFPPGALPNARVDFNLAFSPSISLFLFLFSFSFDLLLRSPTYSHSLEISYPTRGTLVSLTHALSGNLF